jgi:hypothetical protein
LHGGQGIFWGELGTIETLGPCSRLTFSVDQGCYDDGSKERVLVAKVVIPTVVLAAMTQALAAGKVVTEALAFGCDALRPRRIRGLAKEGPRGGELVGLLEPPDLAFDGKRPLARPKLYVASDLRRVGFAFCPAVKGLHLIRMDHMHVAVLQVEI